MDRRIGGRGEKGSHLVSLGLTSHFVSHFVSHCVSHCVSHLVSPSQPLLLLFSKRPLGKFSDDQRRAPCIYCRCCCCRQYCRSCCCWFPRCIDKATTATTTVATMSGNLPLLIRRKSVDSFMTAVVIVVVEVGSRQKF